MGLTGEKKPVYTVTILFKSGATWTGNFHSFQLQKSGDEVTSASWVVAPGCPKIMNLSLGEIAMVTSVEK